jgi:phenylpropionate dioxygenase-like ring-hydroxylating dioxygenase large terminal subunit
MPRLANYWYIAASSRELRARPIRRLVEGRPLVLFRDAGGAPRALLDRCAHRGMALSAGRVRDGSLECPYHGWRYGGGGELVAVPALCAGEPRPRARCRSYPARELDRQIWVWIGSAPPDSGPFRFPHLGEPGWSTFFMRTRFEAPVETCLENFLDVPHTLFVHPGLFRGSRRRPTRVRVRRSRESVEAEFIGEAELEGIGPRLLAPRGARMTHTDRFILPSITRVDYGFGDLHGFIITSQCTGRAEDVVDVTTAITWNLRVPAWIAVPFLRWYCRRVIQQDVRVVKVLGEQERTFGRTFLDTRADVLGRHILELRRRAAEGSMESGESEEVVEEAVISI